MGVTVGAVAIVLLISIGLGVRRDLRSQVEDFGVNVLIVLPGRVEQNMFNPNLAGQSYLQPEDAARVRQVPGVREAALLTFVGGGIRAGEKTAYPFLIAAEPSWFRVRPVKLDAGRTYTEAAETEDVAVIGSIAKEELFGDQDAIGLVGGVIGLALSMAVAAGLTTWTPIEPSITSSVVAVCFGVSAGVGTLFGLIPAVKASRRDPVTSLRGV